MIANNVKISVITPLFINDIAFIEKCYNNLKNQMTQDFEWIIVTNEDADINLNKFIDINVNIIQKPSQEVMTANKARNIGIEHANGDYIYFLDIDDYIHEHTLLSLYTCAKLDNDVVVRGNTKNSHLTPTNNYAYQERVDQLLNGKYIDYRMLQLKNASLLYLNVLIHREFILKNNIRFDESLKGNLDIGFMSKIYSITSRVIYDNFAIYVKLQRSDTVRYPSLKERLAKDIALELPKSYTNTIKKIDNADIKANLDMFIVKYYTKKSELIYSESDKYIQDDILRNWATAFSLITTDVFKNKNKHLSLLIREFKMLKNFEINKAKMIAKRRLKLRKVKKFHKASSKSKLRTAGIKVLNLFTKLPISSNTIMFESFLGKNMSDSPKYIYNYLSENYPGKFKFVWVFNNIRENLPEDIIQVKRFSLNHLYYIATSKFWISNMRQPKWYPKRDNQIFLSCWHGTPLKKLVFDMDEVHSATKTYKQDFYDQSRNWDYLISANKYSTDIFKSAFLFDNPILELGYPRNDLLHHPNKEDISNQLKEKLGIPKDKKIVCYCPTWRDDEYYKPGKYKFKLALDLKRLRKELGDEYFFILRTHYFIADSIDVKGLENFVYNASTYDDVTELYLMSDVLITDYSSVFFDYANLKRPILFFTYDLEKYRDTLRGFYLDIEKDCPGPIIKTNSELIEVLKDFDKLKNEYKDDLDKFYERFCYLDDGNAAKRISEEVILKNLK